MARFPAIRVWADDVRKIKSGSQKVAASADVAFVRERLWSTGSARPVLSALPVRWSRRYDPHVARSPENLWLNAFMGLLTVSGFLVAANVAIAVTRPHYSFWTSGVMIAAYTVGTLAVICFLGAMRQWWLPLLGDRSPSGQAPLPRPAQSTTHEPSGQVVLPRSSPPLSTADLDGLSDEQMRLLRVSISGLQDLKACLADLGQTLRPSLAYAEVSAHAQSSADRAKAQLHDLAQQVSIRSWPHEEWALSFRVAERKVCEYIDIEQQPDGKKLAGAVADLLRLLADQYPSLFTR
jgi:hypothetical protein